MNQSAAETDERSGFPSCGVKQKPVTSRPSGLTWSEGSTKTVWFRIRPKWPWSRPNEKTEAKRYVTARIVLTPEAAIELFNICTQMVGALKNAGVLKETPAPQAAAGPRN